MSRLKDIMKTPLARRLRQSRNKSISKSWIITRRKRNENDKDNPRAAEIKNQ